MLEHHTARAAGTDAIAGGDWRWWCRTPLLLLCSTPAGAAAEGSSVRWPPASAPLGASRSSRRWWGYEAGSWARRRRRRPRSCMLPLPLSIGLCSTCCSASCIAFARRRERDHTSDGWGGWELLHLSNPSIPLLWLHGFGCCWWNWWITSSHDSSFFLTNLLQWRTDSGVLGWWTLGVWPYGGS